jgi:type II secretory pathway component PulC
MTLVPFAVVVALRVLPEGASAPASAPPVAASPVGGPDSGASPATEGTLPRSLFDAVMAGGPQRVVASVDVQPALAERRFLGFRIVRFRPDGVLRDCAALLPGDVVVSVNREPLERPEQFMRAWEVVKNAPVLEVDVLRQGRPVKFRWTLTP